MRTAEREAAVADEANFDAVCFHVQQCIEKWMKAALASTDGRIPKIHDLVTLAKLVTAAYPNWTWDLRELDRITGDAVDVRYPGDDATREDAEWSLGVCRRIRPTLLALVSTT